MAPATDDERDRLDRVAAELGFAIDDETAAAVLDTADDLRAAADELGAPTASGGDSVGSLAQDEYGALLEVYDEPRTRTAGGPLDGLTVAVKDVIAARGLTLTCGSRSPTFVPSYDAAVVERLLDAGAALVGKANCDAFAFGPTGEFSEFGRVTNPAASDRVPGGSSSGSGAAVAGGLVDVALGTDTGGSIRIPASCCGVVGAKPTHGLVPRHGFADLAPSTDTIGPLARDVETAALALDAIAGPDLRDPTSSRAPAAPLTPLDDPDELSVGVPDGFLDAAAPPVREVLRRLAGRLDDRADVTVGDVDLDLGSMDAVYPLVLSAEFAWLLRQSFAVRGQGTEYDREWLAGFADVAFTDHAARRVLPAALVDAETDGRAYVAAREATVAFHRRLAECFETVDVLLTPTLRAVPPAYGEVTATEGMADIAGNTAPFSLTGSPAVSVPAGEVDGVPVGAQLVAPVFEDRRALQAARLVERCGGAD